MKKAQGISINVIIIAAIALLVLVILAVLLLGSGQKLSEKKCNALAGRCVPSFECDVGNEIDEATDCQSGETCCKLFQFEG